MIRLKRPPRWIRSYYSSFTWRFFVEGKDVFLTFDDGPHPEITPFVLDLLKEHNWKATFFCVGENVLKYPEIAQRIVNEGHRIGNHTMRHENGFTTPTIQYLKSFLEFEQHHPTALFRPPYGKMKKQQAKQISRKSKIILWSWLTYDFDFNYPTTQILEDAKRLKKGDVIVLHDNPKFNERNLELFPALFQEIKKLGFRSVRISD